MAEEAQTAFRITISNTKYQAMGYLDITFSEMILEGQINHLEVRLILYS
jgi:hypothetical protein